MIFKNYYPYTISLYLILGVIYAWYKLLLDFGLGYLVLAPVPAALFVLVSIYFFYAGVNGLLSKGKYKSYQLQSIALLMQAFQFSFMGIVYANYAGPYVGVGFYFLSNTTFDVQLSIYQFLFSNGYSNNAEPYFFLNLFPLLLWLLYYCFHANREDKIISPNGDVHS